MKRAALIVFFAAVIVWLALKPRANQVTVLHGQAMGCSWTLACHGAAPDSLRHQVASEIEHWEQVLSQWRPDSDLCRHNNGQPATPDLARVIALACELQDRTGGAFDPRLLKQVHQAGFGPAGHGYDLSAIGKGFTIDRVGERLRKLGVSHFIFELGGEVLAGDGDWPSAVENPLPGGPAHPVTLTRRALATSGNYHQFRASENGLVSHIIDPRSGKPVVRRPCSVSVVADDCATADAWATALFVLGPDASPAGAPGFFWSLNQPR